MHDNNNQNLSFRYSFHSFLLKASKSGLNSILKSPARISILGFALLILIGTFLLMIPRASTTHGISFVDALFTSTSASCVTGLTVLDTGHAFTLFGQTVIILLIQTGGLGIMTISTFVILMAGRRPSLTGQIVVKDTLTGGGERDVHSILIDMVRFTFVIEALGAALMYIRFMPQYGPYNAIYISLFHSISAFCNAGFSLFTNGLENYTNDWLINIVISLLIVSGGIGFLVMSELKQKRPHNRRTFNQLSLHSKLVITTTLLLIVSSGLIITLMEWNNTLKGMSPPSRFTAGFFHAISARTAGFNTINVNTFANETLFLLIILMFIGASPGSCGGGVKTTTFATLIILGYSKLRGFQKPRAFYRTISQESLNRAVSIVMISMFIIITGTMLLLITEHTGKMIPMDENRGAFLKILFEVVSAFGTVGLSTGITSSLSVPGKLIITLIMFIGRLGPLVIAMALSRSIAPRYEYAEENVMVG